MSASDILRIAAENHIELAPEDADGILIFLQDPDNKEVAPLDAIKAYKESTSFNR